MLNQHRNLVVPLSDWLKIGECVLDVPRREVTAPQRPLALRITVKAQQVLMVLVSHQDKVVSREALIEWVWPDTLPTDDVLTQAITQLRKAFCDDRETPRYLETIAKGGYRLLASTHWLTAATADADDVSNTAPEPAAVIRDARARVDNDATQTSRKKIYIGIVLGALAIVAVMVAALRPRTPDAALATAPERAGNSAAMMAALPDYQRITSLPGSESWPSVSPDGSQVVYSANSEDGVTAALMVQTTAPVPARELTHASDGRRDVMAAWSPDGREIAFTRLGDKDECSIMLMPSSGGEARTLGHCVPDQMMGYSWHPDGKHLIADGISNSPGEPRSIRVLDLDTGLWRPLPYEKGERDVDLSPRYSPDGKWIAFQRNISLGDLWRMPVSGGRPQRLTRLKTNLYGLSWTPDSKAIVFAGYRDGGTSLLRLDVDSGQIDLLGIPDFDATYPSIGQHAPSLAFELSKSRSMLYSIPFDVGVAGASNALEPVLRSTGKDLLPAVAPDGRQIAFVSDRSASLGLWWAELGRPESLRWIEGIDPVARYAPVWSSDSERLLMVGRSEANTAIYEITPATARVSKLPVPAENPIHAESLPGPSRMLVVADEGAGRLGLILYDRSARPWRRLASIDDVVLARVDAARQRIVFMRPLRAGLWQADFDLRHSRRIAERPAPGAPSGRHLVVMRDGIWLAAAGRACGLRWTALEQPGQPSRCLHVAPLGVTSFSIDEVHGRLYFSSEVEEPSDIGWMQLSGLHLP